MCQNSAVRDAALHSERIDTHGHLGESWPGLEAKALAGGFPGTQQLIDSRVTAEGCRVLYGIDPGAFVRADSPPELFRKSAELRAAGSWQAMSRAMDAARIRKQLVFCGLSMEYFPPFPSWSADQLRRVAYLAYIDPALQGDYVHPCPDFHEPDYPFYDRICGLLGSPNTLDDYLAALDAEIDGWRARGVVGMKTAMAYTTGLSVSDPAPAEARAAFARKRDMTGQDFLAVRDFAFRRALDACRRNGLPVVIHTGFQIWGHANLSQANPLLLHNLLVDPQYRDIPFVLLHGGNPYIGETAYLVGMFPNVFLDFTGISWMTPARFRLALGEWLAEVPHDRFCWGSDSGSPESIAGIDSITRRLIADVLDASVAEGMIDEKYALEFVENTYLKTPQRVFGLL